MLSAKALLGVPRTKGRGLPKRHTVERMVKEFLPEGSGSRSLSSQDLGDLDCQLLCSTSVQLASELRLTLLTLKACAAYCRYVTAYTRRDWRPRERSSSRAGRPRGESG